MGKVGALKGMQEGTGQIWRCRSCISENPVCLHLLPRVDSYWSQPCSQVNKHSQPLPPSILSLLFCWNGNFKSLIAPQGTEVRQEGDVFMFTFASPSCRVTAGLMAPLMKAAAPFHPAKSRAVCRISPVTSLPAALSLGQPSMSSHPFLAWSQSQQSMHINVGAAAPSLEGLAYWPFINHCL